MDTVLLLGDSIRILYGKYVKQGLSGQAKVVWPEENCRFSLYTLRCLFQWASLADNAKDVVAVHWNNGLWDVMRRTADGECLTSLEEYRRNLKRIIFELRARFPRAVIVFATTTCVNPRFSAARNADIIAYNAAALEVMAEYGIPVDDLYAVVSSHPEYIRDDDLLHVTEEGAMELARCVCETIKQILNKKEH